MRWLALLTTLPPTPTRHRVGVWRKLQRMGAVRPRGAGWILPETPETTERFQWARARDPVGRRRGDVAAGRSDRMAWLIKRFCDPDAAFAFADAADAARKGIPFDVLGADLGHHGEDCTFETLVKRFAIKDRRVTVIAEIVHEADLHDGKFTRNEAAGLHLAINGLVEATADDDGLLARGMEMFEGLYAVLKQKT